MLRFIAQWYVSRAIDCRQSLPTWVQRRMSKDPALRQFHDQSLELAARLRGSVSEPHLYAGAPTPSAWPSSKSSVRTKLGFATVAVGLAAALLLMLVPIISVTGVKSGSEAVVLDSGQRITEADLASPIKPSRMTPEELRGLLAASRDWAQSLNQSALQIAQPLIEAERFGELLDLNVEQVMQPAGQLGTNYGAALSELDQHIQHENQRLISDGIVAWRFFAQRLPESAATLAGW